MCGPSTSIGVLHEVLAAEAPDVVVLRGEDPGVLAQDQPRDRRHERRDERGRDRRAERHGRVQRGAVVVDRRERGRHDEVAVAEPVLDLRDRRRDEPVDVLDDAALGREHPRREPGGTGSPTYSASTESVAVAHDRLDRARVRGGRGRDPGAGTRCAARRARSRPPRATDVRMRPPVANRAVAVLVDVRDARRLGEHRRLGARHHPHDAVALDGRVDVDAASGRARRRVADRARPCTRRRRRSASRGTRTAAPPARTGRATAARCGAGSGRPTRSPVRRGRGTARSAARARCAPAAADRGGRARSTRRTSTDRAASPPATLAGPPIG